MTTALKKELATFEAHRDELVGKANGQFVLIRGDEIAGCYDTEGDAINEGYRRYGNVPFLVKHVVEVDVPECFVSNLLAL